MTRFYQEGMNSDQITEQNWKEYLYGDGLYEDYDYETTVVIDVKKVEDLIQSLITSIKQEEREKLFDIDDWIEKKCFGHDYDDHIGPIEQILVVSVDDLKDYIQSLTEEDGNIKGCTPEMTKVEVVLHNKEESK